MHFHEEHPLDLLGAYALGILDGEEREQVARHLAGCDHCQAELRTYHSVVEQLPMAAPQRTPPLRLRQAILHEAASPHPKKMARDETWFQKIMRPFSNPAWALVSVFLIVGLVASNVFLWQRVNRLQENASGELQMAELSGTSTQPSASGVLVYSRDGKSVYMVVEGLPPLTESQQYQLWLINEGIRTSGGVFSVRPNGYGVLEVSNPNPLQDYQSFGITIEPAGGSPGPTGVKVMGGSL